MSYAPGGFAPPGYYPGGGFGGGFGSGVPGAITSPLDLPGLPSLPNIDWGAVKEWIDLAEGVMDAYRAVNTSSDSLWGHRPYAEVRPFEVCPGTPAFDAVERAVRTMPAGDVAWIVQSLRAGNEGKGPADRAQLADPRTLPNWVKAVMGGTDCENKRFPDMPQRFVGLVAQYGGPGEQEPGVPGDFPSGPTLSAGGGWLLAGLAAAFIVPRLLRG